MIFLLIITIICIIIYCNNINNNYAKCSNNKYEHYKNNITDINNNNNKIYQKNKKSHKYSNNSYLKDSHEKLERKFPNKNMNPSKIKNSNKFLKNYELIKNHYHTDYKDIITIINNIFTSNESKFNIGNLPVKYIKINKNEMDDVNELVHDFIDNINHFLINMPENRNEMSGWNEILNEKTIESGWEKQRKSLGLSPSLYNEPAKNDIIKLIDIMNVEKYITIGTINEEKISIMIVLRKLNIKDMILIKIDFLKNLFENKSLIIDNIYIIGYIMKKTDIYTDGYSKNNNFYHFDELNKGEFIDLGVISSVLLKKYQEQQKYNEMWMENLDDNDKYYLQ